VVGRHRPETRIAMDQVSIRVLFTKSCPNNDGGEIKRSEKCVDYCKFYLDRLV
jgi:hypothetical protein